MNLRVAAALVGLCAVGTVAGDGDRWGDAIVPHAANPNVWYVTHEFNNLMFNVPEDAELDIKPKEICVSDATENPDCGSYLSPCPVRVYVGEGVGKGGVRCRDVMYVSGDMRDNDNQGCPLGSCDSYRYAYYYVPSAIYGPWPLPHFALDQAPKGSNVLLATLPNFRKVCGKVCKWGTVDVTITGCLATSQICVEGAEEDFEFKDRRQFVKVEALEFETSGTWPIKGLELPEGVCS